VVKTETNNIKQNQHKEQTANVLIVDNDAELIRFMLEILAKKGIRGFIANDKKAALKFLEKADCDLIFTSSHISQTPDLPPQPQTAFDLLQKIKANSPELPVIMLTNDQNHKTYQKSQSKNHELIETAVKAIRAGCSNFIIKPPQRQNIENILDSLLPNHCVQTHADAQQDTRTLYRIVGRSAKLAQSVELANRIAPTSAPVLISGESGTGKELISFLIHYKSKRVHGPYIKVNCAALSNSLLESELFGHEKGAFTDACSQRKGRFEMAHGGTLLLDEISETPLKFQAKLLRVIEQQDFQRVGGNENINVNVRIISTTNKDLLQQVQQNRFRQDLYYRLSAVRLVLPPLRERPDDLTDLVWHFVNLYARETQRHITKLDPAMMNIFAKYHWPGNVRQLRNVVLTSLILGIGSTLSLADVSWLFDELQPLPEITNPNDNATLAGIPLEKIEKRAILDTLRQTAGNQTKAAKVLGISDRTLRDKIRRYRRECPLQLTKDKSL